MCLPPEMSVSDRTGCGALGPPSLHDPAAIHVERLAGDEARAVGAEEEERLGDVLRPAPALERLVVEDEAGVGVWVGVDLLGVRWRVAGGDRVGRDAISAQLARPGPGESDQRGLR